MVRKYKKKSDRCSWSEEDLHLALDNIKQGKSIKSSAAAFGVPRSTLQLKYFQIKNNCFEKANNSKCFI